MTAMDKWLSEESRLRDCNISITVSQGHRAGDYDARTRATDRDRGDYQSRLDTAYAEGALTRDEYDARSDVLGRSALRDHLAILVSDLPAPYRNVVMKPRSWPGAYNAVPVSVKCISGVLLGIGQFLLAGCLTGGFSGHAGTGGNALTIFSALVMVITVLFSLVGTVAHYT